MQNEAQITALLIAPQRELAQELIASLPQTRGFQILADLKNYPPAQTLEIRVRQLKPEVVLLDLATDLNVALGLIQFLTGLTPPIHVVGLHIRNDSQAILQSLRAGATEFLAAPFEASTQRDAITRLRRLCVPEKAPEPEGGHVITFSSSKPGSGASTLATQTAFSLQRITGRRILLADFDLTGGTIGFYLKLSHPYSVVDALQHAEHLDSALWTSLAVNHGGLDILPSPAAPYADAVDPNRMRVLIEHARHLYDWIILDTPTVFSQTSLMAVSEAEKAFIVTTADLPSLHLTRKAMNLIEHVGFERARFQVLMNRVDKRDGLGIANMEKLFNCPVYANLPNDYFSLHRVVTLGQPLGTEGDLGKAIENVALRLCGGHSGGKKPAGAAREMRPALSGV
ncbi:MAG TPA: P-loop NTPase [Bryobacteraceae bacterium]|nr:P-loop NTPase [Bryobacteraceae bacterium]